MRAAAKTATYSLMHFAVAGSVAYAITGDWRAALAISMIEPMVQTVAYAIHERIWERVWPPRAAFAAHAMHAHGDPSWPNGATSR